MVATIQGRRSGWRLWLVWVLATGIGLMLGAAGGVAAMTTLGGAVGETLGDDFFPSGPVSVAALLVVLPGSIGTAQWLVLRRRLSRAGWWVLATIIGFWLGLLLLFGVGRALAQFWPPMPGFGRDTTSVEALNGIAFAALLGGSLGIPFGVAQWAVLLRQLSKAGWWVPAAAAGWAVTLAAYAATFIPLDTLLVSDLAGIALLLMIALVMVAALGAITGAGLVQLFRHTALIDRAATSRAKESDL